MNSTLPSHTKRPWAALLCASLIAVGGCGGSDGGGTAPAPAPTPPAPANQPPVAAFTAAASLAASAPLALDASGSTDADGDSLTYSWNFGDGTRGGGAQLAHVFAAAGDYTVTLTVADGRGGSASATRVVSVSAAAAAGAPASVQAVVTDSAAPLAGVAVGVQGGAGAATTAADGKADLMVATGTPQMLKFSKAGYADQFKPVDLIAGASGASINVRMLPREGALTLADAAAGGTLNGKDGALVTIPPNSLIDANGAPVTGAVQVNVTPVNVGANPGAFPGAFQGYQPSGARGLIASYGTVEYVLTQNGVPVHLAPGRKATVEIPIYTSRHIDGSDVVAGVTIPLWSLDERTGLWIQEGTGTVVASSGSPSELALRAEVGHFSWWNCDQWLGVVPEGSYNPNTRCCIRDTPNGPCKENSGDICRAEGSPKNPSNSASSARARSLAADPSTRRIPTTVATASVPALAGGVLPMPANLDIDVVATARNGTYRGNKTFRGAAGVSETVAIDLLPVASGGNDVPITLPWDQVYSMQAVAQQAGYRLAMPVGAGFEVRVSPSGGNLAGTVRLLRPDATVFANAPFGPSNTATIVVPTVAVAGDYRIEVTASGGVPGAFRLEAASLAACGSIETLTLPATPTITLGPKQSRCYDIALAADEVIQVDIDQINNGIQGSVSLATANGLQTLTSFAHPSMSGSRRLLTGVAVAGTYRLRATNTTGNTGSYAVLIKKPVLPVLTVPGSASFADLIPTEERLFLVKPPADGLFHVALANTAGQIGVQFDPSLAWFTISGTPSARVQRVTAPVLPVLSVFRNTGTGTITITTGAPTVVARDADIAGTVSAGDLRVYAFEGAVGDAFAYGMASPEASGSTASLGVYTPNGGVLSSVNGVNTVAENGPHTALVMASSGTDNPFTFRINTAPAPVALTLTPPVTSQTIDMPLGQVVRYTFDVTQAELIGLRLATPGSFYVTASIGVADAALATPNFGAGPFAVSSPPRFVNASANATLTLRSPGNALERARGNVTVGVVRPVPAVANFNVPVTGSLALHEWTSYRYTVPASGRYLLRLTTTASAPFDVVGTVWAPSTILTGYPGEFTSIVSSSGGMSLEGLGLLTAGNHTVTVRNSNAGPTQVPFTMTLVNLENPVALTVGGSPIAGSIDTDGERDYLSFAGVANQAVTVRVTAAFNGVLRVRKLNPSGNFADRTGELLNVGGTPLALEAAVERSVAFTIPAAAPFGSGTYIVEVAGNANATGNYSAQVVSP